MKTRSRRRGIPSPRPPFIFFLFLALLVGPGEIRAQEPAILTVDAFALGAGSVQLSYGAEYSAKEEDVTVNNSPPAIPPTPSPFLTRLMPLSARIGVSHNVDLIFGWRGRLIGSVDNGQTYRDWGDPSVITKITLTDTGLVSAAGLLIGVKLPSARYLPARLGSDAMDAYFLATFSHRFGRGEFRANAGVGIIGDPRFTGSQDDIFTGSALVLARAVEQFAIYTELYGFTGPRENDDKLQLRGGASFDAPFATLSVYALGRIAGNRYDFSTAFLATPEWGIGASLTHRFNW